MDENSWEVATDAELIRQALRIAVNNRGKRIRSAIPGVTPEVKGVTEHDISRWSRTPDSSLSNDKRDAIIRALNVSGVRYKGGEQQPNEKPTPEEGAGDWRRLAMKKLDEVARQVADPSFTLPEIRDELTLVLGYLRAVPAPPRPDEGLDDRSRRDALNGDPPADE